MHSKDFPVSGFMFLSVGTVDIVIDGENMIMGFHGNQNLGDGKSGVVFERIDENGGSINKFGIAITRELPRVVTADGSVFSFVPMDCFGCTNFNFKPGTKPLWVLSGEHKVIEGTYQTQQDINMYLRVLQSLDGGTWKSDNNIYSITLVNIDGKYGIESGWFWIQFGEFVLRDIDIIINKTDVDIAVRSSYREVPLPTGEGFGGGMMMKATTVVPKGATMGNF